MHPDNEEMIAFRLVEVLFCYHIMPYGLKNAWLTYQQVMAIIFKEMLGCTVECYMENLVIKSCQRMDHLRDLKSIFDQL